ncbi:HAD family hydrolase [Streptantibioticus rubrisoli]|uniref:HAD-IA family hydrolase n=1 Tax=Streptantibioticus rubrisoli TaxID=1387313 RepID=A0ABT1PCB2_9ACTN|nr:HAD-IA family hydrolase [Streptantibioticus rubrisoli]MCQ4042999.1 HAD-IA family hydrolase [Streptantibioticus rubrisoli]
MGTDTVARTLAQASAILFDFDGPLCDVFAGLPAPQVARQLAQLAAPPDSVLSAKLADTDDPLEVLRLTHATDTALGLQIEQALTAAEIEAVAVAGDPTPGAVAALEAAQTAGRRVAVVSNNSSDCVHAFLARHSLTKHVHEVVGRPLHRPDLMKPDPHSLIRAADQLGTATTQCVLIGDSVTDIEAAHAAGSTAIGYANKPHKLRAFADARAEAITEHMQTIADAMQAPRSR